MVPPGSITMICEPILHIHAPQPDRTEVKEIWCPNCGASREMLAEHVPWYGWGLTCLSCGDAWEDGERLPRPFKPRWREESITRAQERLAQAA